MNTLYLLQQLLNAAFLSAVYGLLAVSYVLMHGLTRRVNLAFGSLSAWSGAMTVSVALALMLRWPGDEQMAVVVAIAVALLNTTAIGVALARGVVRPLVEAGSLAMLTATLGIALVLEESIRLLAGNREMWLMPILPETIRLGGTDSFVLQVTVMQIVVFAAAVLSALVLILLIARHPFGRIWRACAEDQLMAELCGVDTGRALTTTFLIASVAVAIAGILIALAYGAVTFYSGLITGLKTLFVAIIGGLNSVSGAFAGALILGLFETFWAAYLGGEWRDVAAFAALALLLALFPEGLFASTESVDHRWRSQG